jgi:hypothetical protein
MIVKAVRPFISAQFGNVEPGRVLEMPDAKARFLMRSGLVAEHANPLPNGSSSSFRKPVDAGQAGSSLPADQASQKKTVRPSEGGEPNPTYRRKGKSRS